MLFEQVRACTSLQDKAKRVWEHYLERRLPNNMEPAWTHMAYELIQRYANDPASVTDKDLLMVKDTIYSHEMPDGTEVASFPNVPQSPVRIMHEGWKIGTPTWVFMGRNHETGKVLSLGQGWISVLRHVPEELHYHFDSAMPKDAWIAYNLKDQMGMSALTANCVGPELYFHDLITSLERQTGKQFIKRKR